MKSITVARLLAVLLILVVALGISVPYVAATTAITTYQTRCSMYPAYTWGKCPSGFGYIYHDPANGDPVTQATPVNITVTIGESYYYASLPNGSWYPQEGWTCLSGCGGNYTATGNRTITSNWRYTPLP